MTNEPSSPALVPGILPENLFPEMTCSGVSSQQAYEIILGITQVALAAGQRGPQGVQGPAGPAAKISVDTVIYSLSSGQQNITVNVETGGKISDYFFSLTNPTDSGTALSPAPAIAYLSRISDTAYRLTLTAPTPASGWTITRSRIIT